MWGRRVIEAEHAKAQAEKARKRVSVEVGLRMDGFILSEPLREFIGNVWFQVLFVRCLRAGNDSLLKLGSSHIVGSIILFLAIDFV